MPRFTYSLALLLAVASLAPAHAAKDKATHPLALRAIMQGLNKDMQRIGDRIAYEDWAAVAKLAPLLARHQHVPAAESARIAGFLGPDAPRFAAMDAAAHEGAHGLMEAAARRDGQAVIAAFAAVQSSCLACHQSFRQSLVLHFYGAGAEAGE